jgi:hypothetical protein
MSAPRSRAFAYCDFHHQGGNQMLMARAVARPRSLHAAEQTTGSVGAPHTEVAARVETPRVEAGRIEPVRAEAKPDAARNEGPLELRRSTE